MFMNGVRTGMETIAAVRRPILQDHHLALATCAVAAAWATLRGSAGCRIVATALPTSGSNTTASALFFSNYNYNPSFCTKLKPSVIDGVKQASEGRTKQVKRNE